jgi:hypothetical protein
VSAQSPPATVAQRYFAAIVAQQWDSAAALVDPVSQRGFRNRVLSYLLFVAEQRPTIRRSMQGSGSGGLAAGDLDAAPTAAQLAKYGEWHVGVYPGAPAIKDLAALSPADLLARSYAASSVLCIEGSCQAERPLGRPLVLGAVIESDSIAHALYRETRSDTSTLAHGEDRWRVEVIHLFKRDDGWLVSIQRGPLPSLYSLMDEKMGLRQPSTRRAPKSPDKKGGRTSENRSRRQGPAR